MPVTDPGGKGKELLLSVREEEGCAWRPAAGIEPVGSSGAALTAPGRILRGHGHIRDRRTADFMNSLCRSGKALQWRIQDPEGGRCFGTFRIAAVTIQGEDMYDIPCALALEAVSKKAPPADMSAAC